MRLAARSASWLALLGVAAMAGPLGAQEIFDAATVDFARSLELSAFERLGVQDAGRVKIFDTFAREQVGAMTGQASLDGTSPTFSYLELYFNASAYLDKPVIQVRQKDLRKRLALLLPPGAASVLDRTRRLPPRLLLGPQTTRALASGLRGTESLRPAGRTETSLRMAIRELSLEPALRQAVDRLEFRADLFAAPAGLRLAPSPGDATVWRAIEDLSGTAAGPEGRAYRAMAELGRAWRARDAAAANAAMAEAVAHLRAVNPAAQPSAAKAAAELAYNRVYRFTLVWVGYLVSFVLFLAAVVRPGRWPRRAGLVVLTLSTAALAAGFGIRWWLSGRPWYLPPVTGQFESVTGAALLGAACSLLLERIWRRNYFAMAASFFAAAMLLCGWLLPHAMNADIRPPAGILNNWILPLHVGIIILGYAFVAMGLVISAAYLGVLGLSGRRRADDAWSTGPDLTGPRQSGLLAELDHSNLIVAQLACWLITLGTILGAYWADYSWGRWWGFDPKETWALITMLVYLAIVHGRFAVSVRHRGLWTAVLTVLGAGVVFFNWVIVKYLLPSLHGYA